MIVGICGSPRKQSTEYVLLEALNIFKKAVEIDQAEEAAQSSS